MPRKNTNGNVLAARIELNLEKLTRRQNQEAYVAAITEAVHKNANTTSFFHSGQVSGSSGSDVG